MRTVHVTHKHSRLPRPVKAAYRSDGVRGLGAPIRVRARGVLRLAGIRSDGQRQFWSNAAPLRHRDFSTLMTQSGPDAPAQSVGRVARLSGNVRQPNHVLANEIAGHKAERRPRAGEEWLAATKYDGVEVKSILINKTKVG